MHRIEKNILHHANKRKQLRKLNNTNIKTMEYLNDYENQTLTKKHVNEEIIPSVYDSLVDDYGFGSDDYDSDPYENIHEIIDGMSEVIYNYKAKKIAQAFDYCPFNSVSEMTGEKFPNYNVMAYEIIYNGVVEKYHEQLNKP
tara:strand:+ start:13648 stop:14073 length:426 start_codon:yes stop_codon:yes gene_type:complete